MIDSLVRLLPVRAIERKAASSAGGSVSFGRKNVIVSALGSLCPVPVKSVTWGLPCLEGVVKSEIAKEEGGHRRDSKGAFSCQFLR